MRNLVEYPVTPEEIVEGLREIQKRAAEGGGYGDMEPVYLKAAIDVLQAARAVSDRVGPPGAAWPDVPALMTEIDAIRTAFDSVNPGRGPFN